MLVGTLLPYNDDPTLVSEAQWGVLGGPDYTGAFQRSDQMGQESEAAGAFTLC